MKIHNLIFFVVVLILNISVYITLNYRNNEYNVRISDQERERGNHSSQDQLKSEEGLIQFEERYILPAFSSGMLSYSWDNPNEIEPYHFVLYYAFDESHRSSFRENPETMGTEIPAELVEQCASDFFNVSSDRVRQAEEYDNSRNVYLFNGLGGGASVRLNSVSESDKKLILDYECYGGQNDEQLWFGTLTIDRSKTDEGVYLSNKSSLDGGV